MNRRKRLILFVAGGLILLAVVAGFLTRDRNDDEGRYDQLIGALRAEARFDRWRTTAPYRLVARVTGFDAVSHFRQKADQLESSLYKRGALTSLTFFAPNLSGSRGQINWPDTPHVTIINPSKGAFFIMDPTQPRRTEPQFVRCTFYTG